MNQMKFKQTAIGLIPEDWEVVTLSELLFIKGRIGWKGLKKSEFGNDGIVIINGPNLKNGAVDWKSCLRVPKWRYDESKEIAVRKNDILMTKDGTIGKIAHIKHLPEPATLASGIFLIRSKSEKLDQDFLYQYFNSNFFKGLVESRIEGSVIPHLYQRDIEQLSMPLPPLAEQLVIAKTLSGIDSKISLNRNISKTLEELGRTIYKHWFVDFEFSNEAGKPYRSSGGEMKYDEEFEMKIPKGWRIGKLEEIVEFAYGKNLPKTKRQPGNYPVFGSNGIIGYHSDYLVQGPGIVIGRKGTLGEVYWVEENFFPIDTTFYLINKLKSNSLYFHYFLLKGQDFLKSSSDSAVPGLNRNMAYSNEVIIPPINLISKFNRICLSLFNKKHNVQIQLTNFFTIHNSLLPKLISGKIKVPIETRK